MTTARFGPVHLDFPMDVQNSYLTTTIIPIIPKQDDKVLENPNIDNFIKLLCDSLSQSLKPTFYFGNGLRNSPHLKALMEQINKFRIPYFVSWSAIDMFDSNDLLNLGRVGIYGDRASNILVQKSDFLLCLGTRLSIPQTGYDRSDFARKANKWIVEVDPTEMSKFDSKKWSSLICDVNIFLPTFIEILSNMDPEKFGNLQLWNKEIRTIKEAFPQESQYEKVSSSNNRYLHSIEFVKELNTLLPGNSTVVTDVGAALLSTHFIFSNFDKFRLLTSQGLGEMGFGLPAAIGSFIADNKRTLVCINNDGSMMMNLQELQTMKFLEIPIKLFILNNYGYSSIRISQSNLYDSNYVGIDSSSGLSFPDFSDIAQTFGFKYVLIDGETTERQNKIKTILADSQPYLVEVSISPNQKFLPRLSTMRDKDGAFISPPLEDLEPLIEYRDLKNGLGYEPHINSKMIRNLTTEEETL
jgi:acetolactate synthase-1/2/3 large subunit